MSGPRTLQYFLDDFMKAWVSNPAAQMQFVKLIEAVLDCPKHDHADYELREWIDERKSSLRSIGIR